MSIHTGKGIRVDSLLFVGCLPAAAYDPLLAKLIVSIDSRTLIASGAIPDEHAETTSFRALLSRTRRALGEFHVAGLDTNVGFLRELLGSTGFEEVVATGSASTGWLQAYTAALIADHTRSNHSH